MKNFKHIRTGMGLSQLKIATYLGVSRSLVYFIEKGQRSLPTRALIKFAQLEQTFNEMKGSVSPSPEDLEAQQNQQREQVNKYLLDKEKLINRRDSLVISLTKKKRAYRTCMNAVITNNAVAYNMHHIKADKGDELWLWTNISGNSDALKYCNMERQKALMTEIRKINASIDLLNEYIQMNMLRIEMPVVRLFEAA